MTKGIKKFKQNKGFKIIFLFPFVERGGVEGGDRVCPYISSFLFPFFAHSFIVI